MSWWCDEGGHVDEVGWDISVLAQFCSRVGANEIQSARRVPCRSSTVLCNATEAILTSCQLLGLDGYFGRVSQAFSQFENSDEVKLLIAVSFGDLPP